ncbi:MAG: DUF2254 family protein [Acidimicrobiales bacterium]
MPAPPPPASLIDQLATPRRQHAFTRPLLLSLIAAAAAAGVRWLEVETSLNPGWLEVSPDAARTYLATIAGTMVTATIVVFWVRGLVVSTHAGRIPNRVLSDYLSDRYQQWVMGSMVGVFTFAAVSVLALSVGTSDGPAQEASGALSVVLGTVLAVTALLMIIQSIDTGVRSMHEQRLMRRVLESAFGVIERDYPRHCDQPGEEVDPRGDEPVETVSSTEIGWVQAIDEEALIDAIPPGTTVWLEARIGDFVSPATALCRVTPPTSDGLEHTTIQQAFTLEDTRDPDRDLSLALRNLVDIAMAALADHTDPTTGREAIAHLGSVLRPIVAWDGPSRVRRGEDGRRVVRGAEPDYAKYLNDAFTDLGRLGADPVTAQRLLSVLGDLSEAARAAGRFDRVQVIDREVDVVMERLERNGVSESELEWVRRRLPT